MPKKETLDIQIMLRELGEKLGFEACIEEQMHGRETYAPIYDVVWYLNLDKVFDFSYMKPLFGENGEWFERMKKFPFAGFEVEGSTTSSKNQLSNLANLYSGNFMFNFIIVNNSAAGNENDTYRRGVKLNRYFIQGAGYRHNIFMDRQHLEMSISALDCYDAEIETYEDSEETRGTFGGETRSVDAFDAILPYILGSGLAVKQNYSPDIYKAMFAMHKDIETTNENEAVYLNNAFYKLPLDNAASPCKLARDSYYIPKLDVVLGFNAPKGFCCWLKEVGGVLRSAVAGSPLLYGVQQDILKPLFIPLISIEIETTVGKHMNGGIFNMSKNSYLGILVTNENADSHMEYYKRELGIKNVITYCIGENK